MCTFDVRRYDFGFVDANDNCELAKSELNNI